MFWWRSMQPTLIRCWFLKLIKTKEITEMKSTWFSKSSVHWTHEMKLRGVIWPRLSYHRFLMNILQFGFDTDPQFAQTGNFSCYSDLFALLKHFANISSIIKSTYKNYTYFFYRIKSLFLCMWRTETFFFSFCEQRAPERLLWMYETKSVYIERVNVIVWWTKETFSNEQRLNHFPLWKRFWLYTVRLCVYEMFFF